MSDTNGVTINSTGWCPRCGFLEPKEPHVCPHDRVTSVAPPGGSASEQPPYDKNPMRLCPDPILGTRAGWEWCGDCAAIREPGHGCYR